MALQSSVTYCGFNLADCYIRVNRIFGSKREKWDSIIGVYKSKADADNGNDPIQTFNFAIAWVDGQQPESLIYTALKASKYPSATDV